MIMLFSEQQAGAMPPWVHFAIRSWLRARYEGQWLWYWVHWENNHELLM